MVVSLSLTASIALWAVGCLPSRDHRPHGVRFEALRAKSAETIDGNVVARAAYIDDHFGDPHVGGSGSCLSSGVVVVDRLSRGLLELRLNAAAVAFC